MAWSICRPLCRNLGPARTAGKTPFPRAGRAYIGNWSNPQDIVVWHFDLATGGNYRVKVDAKPACREAVGQQVCIIAGDEKLTGNVTVDGVKLDKSLQLAKLTGKITPEGVQLHESLKLAAGQVTLFVQLLDAKRTGPPILDLFQVELAPVK